MTTFAPGIPALGTLSAALRTAVADRYAVDAPSAGDEIRLVSSMDPSETLSVMPPEGSKDYGAMAAKVSTAIQEALRVWLPYLWLGDLENFASPGKVAVMLGYSACRTYRARTSHYCNFDILNGDTPRAIIYSVNRGLAAKLEVIYAMLTAAGFADARKYSPRRSDEIVERLRQNWHRLNGILVAERDIIEFYTKAALRRDRKQLRRSLKRMVEGADFSGIETMLDMEAARAIDPSFEIHAQFCETLTPASALPPHADTPMDRGVLGLLPVCLV